MAILGTRITSKGQVTIPKKVRDYLGIAPGSTVDFTLADDGRVVLTKTGGKRRPSRFARLRGRATVAMTTDEIMALTRGEA
jgi:AbrB family looped-hinge helix DNA binding protein